MSVVSEEEARRKLAVERFKQLINDDPRVDCNYDADIELMGEALLAFLDQWAGPVSARAHIEMELRRVKAGLCPAHIWHGSGHQSSTFCHANGEHTLHEAAYGPGNTYVRWRGYEVMTGYFDQPPEEDDE